jgi:ribonuclease HI
MGQQETQAVHVTSEEQPQGDAADGVPLGAIIYADAGVRPVNPGFGGWGFHGYTYASVAPKKSMGPGHLALTPSGYVPKSEKHPEITPIHYVDSFGTIPYVSNNGAEVLAAAHAMSCVSRWDINALKIKTDSKYVITGAMDYLPRWKSNNWCKADGTTVSNVEHWQFLDKHMNALQAKGVSITFEWVKGHNGDQGNEMADKYATIGALASGAGQDKVMTQIVEAPDYWKPEEESHPLLAHRSMYFVTDRASIAPGEYYLGNHGKDDELLGKRMADGSYSYVQLETADPYIELLIAKQMKVCKNEDHVILARLDELMKPQTRKDLMTFGEEMFIPVKLSRGRQFDMKMVGGSDEEPISVRLNPPLLAMRAVESVNFLKGLFLAWKEGTLIKDGVEVTDITSCFYEDDKKPGKKGEEPKIVGKKIRGDFTSANSVVSVKGNCPPELSGQLATLGAETLTDKTLQPPTLLDIELIVNIDIPNRNVFKKIEKLDPKVTLLVWKESERAYRYACIIEAKGGAAVWCGYYSNYKYRF